MLVFQLRARLRAPSASRRTKQKKRSRVFALIKCQEHAARINLKGISGHRVGNAKEFLGTCKHDYNRYYA